MESTDRRGLAVSSRNATALEHYEAALELTASYFVDPLATITAAIEHEPTCAIAHCLRAALGVMSSERGALPMIRESVEIIEAPATRANARERAHAVAARAWLEGDFARGVQLYGEIAVEHPRDLLAVQTAHIGDFALGQSTFLRDRIAQVLPHWNADVPGYGYVLGMHAFGLEETGLYARGRGHGPARARTEPPRPVGGARRRARNGNAGPHRRWHRMAHVACAGLVDRQRTRVPQLVAPRAAPPRVRRACARAGALRHAHQTGAEFGRTRDGRCLGDALAPVTCVASTSGARWQALADGVGSARRGRLLRVQRRACHVRPRRRWRRCRCAARDRKPRARRAGHGHQRDDVAGCRLAARAGPA